MNQRGVIIVAGGTGVRMGSPLPKQFIPLGAEGKPVLVHSLERMIAAVPDARIVIALPPQEFDRWNEMCSRYRLSGTHTLCAGGDTRFTSVRNALTELRECSTVAVHDGVRPLVSVPLIGRLFECAAKNGSAIPVIFPVDSFRETMQDIRLSENPEPMQIPTRTVDRGRLLAVQTPQVFEYGLLKHAYQTPYNECFTDDASVVEHIGVSLTFCMGERENIKITTPADIIQAEALLSAGY